MAQEFAESGNYPSGHEVLPIESGGTVSRRFEKRDNDIRETRDVAANPPGKRKKLEKRGTTPTKCLPLSGLSVDWYSD
jgi:hypothetical protein